MGKTANTIRRVPILGRFARILYSVWKLPEIWEDLHADAVVFQKRQIHSDTALLELHRLLTATNADLQSLQAQVKRHQTEHNPLAARVDALEIEVRRMHTSISGWGTDVKARVIDHDARLDELALEIASLDSYARKSDIDELRAELGRRNDEIRSILSPPQPEEPVNQGVEQPEIYQDFMHRLDGITDLLNHFSSRIDSLQANSERAGTGSRAVYVGNNEILAPLAYGGFMLCPARDVQVTPQLIQSGEWEPAITRVLQQSLRPGMKFLDIGANIGYFSVLAAKLVGDGGRVHAFEPVPNNFRLLEMNCSLNHLRQRCQLHPLALSSSAGEVIIHTFERNSASATLAKLPERLLSEFNERPKEERAPATTLDEQYKGDNTVFDMVKLDAEGAEPLIFEGGARFFEQSISKDAVLILEYNPPAIQGLGRTPSQFLEGLLAAGYQVWKLIAPGKVEWVARPSEIAVWDRVDLLLSRSSEPIRI